MIRIPHEHLGCLFDRFFTTKPSGTGLGLSVVHTILKEHRSTIRFNSQQDQGATVNIELPIG